MEKISNFKYSIIVQNSCDFCPTPISNRKIVCIHKTEYKIQKNVCRGTMCSRGEQNNLDVIWTLVEYSVKRVGNCTAITRILTVFLPVMYVRSIEICVPDQQMHTADICLSYKIHLPHLSLAIAIIIRVRTPWTL
jgi:hypothetical protein